jgi:hypothetical protein
VNYITYILLPGKIKMDKVVEDKKKEDIKKQKGGCDYGEKA